MSQDIAEGYEQMTIDLTLDRDRDLKDNTATMIQFAYKQIIEDQHPDRVKNKHEGYGIAAEAYSSLASAMKTVKGDMDTFLKLLPSSESDAINICGSLYSSAATTAMKAIVMAAECQRIINDLYYGEGKTPIEIAIETMEGSEDDGFDEAGEPEQEDALEDGQETEEE